MSTVDQIAARVRSQKELLPALYDRFDFDQMPERFAAEPEDVTEFRAGSAFPREEMLKDSDLVGRFREYTNLGDITGDAYAALMPQYGKPLTTTGKPWAMASKTTMP